MLGQFESNILKSALFTKKQKLVVAISGGVDSVVLAHLLKKGGFNFCLAHCNFKLRGIESDADEKFCRELAVKLQVKIFVKVFDTKEYVSKNKVSIQMAARKLRYDWFKTLLKESGSGHVLTAHHASDLVETVFINLLRGTGIKGLKGISAKNGKIIRPLLSVSKEEIEAYAKKNKIKFRLDKSNLEDKYERNFIRLNIIPELKKLNPTLEQTFMGNSFRFRQEADMVNDLLEQREKELVTAKGSSTRIDKNRLKKEKYSESILHFVLKPYGFNKTQQSNIIKNIKSDALVGKNFSSASHQLTIDRKELIIRPITSNSFVNLELASLAELKRSQLLKFSVEKKFVLPKKNELLLNEKKLVFPLTIRVKQKGDKFVPFGMKGFKLLSDFLKDEKLNSFEKENCRLLVNGNGEIIWVAGYRSDDRYKVNKEDKQFIKLTLIGN